MTGSGVDEGKKYIAFVRGNMDQIDKKITDDLWALSAIEVYKHSECTQCLLLASGNDS